MVSKPPLQFAMPIGSRIRELREQMEWSQGDLATRIGVSREAVSQWESGATYPRRKNIIALVRVLGITTEKLYTEGVESKKSPNGLITAVEFATLQSDTRLAEKKAITSFAVMPRDLPVMGVTVGGSDGDFSLNGETVDYARRPPGAAPGTFGLFVQGESMYPRYKRGELVLVTDSRPARPGDDVIVEMEPTNGAQVGICLLKELVKISTTNLTLREFYPETREFVLDRATVRKLWRIYTPTELLASG